MGAGCEEDLVTLWEGVPPPPPTPPGPLAPHRWAPGPSHPHPRLRPVQSPPGWPAGPAQPAPPERRHSWGRRGPHCSARLAAPHLPVPPLLRAGWPQAPASGRPPHLTNRILLWALEGWSRSASAASCSARCSNSFMSSMPLCPGARSDTGGGGRERGAQTPWGPHLLCFGCSWAPPT